MKNKIDGPIPGENYLAETKNYPWHRPPDEADYVSIVNKAVENIMGDPEKSSLALTALESGDSILDFVVGTLRVTVGRGRVPIDMAVLAAGPIAKALETIATSADIKFDRGWKQEPRITTAERVKAMSNGVATEKPAPTPPPSVPEENTGLMAKGRGPAPKEVQSSMLGQSEEETQ